MKVTITGIESSQRGLSEISQRTYRLTTQPGLMINPVHIKLSVERAKRLVTKYPGRVSYPIRWTSEKQRRYVMAKLRREGNLPYRRTGNLAEQWSGSQVGNQVIIANEARDSSTGEFYAQFVIGDFQQRFHRNTGWRQSTDQTINQVIEPLGAGIVARIDKVLSA